MMASSQEHRTMLVAEQYRDSAQSLVASSAGPDQAGMFLRAVQSPPVYAVTEGEGEEGGEVYEVSPATLTHYISTGMIDKHFAEMLPLDEWDPGELKYIRVREPDYDSIVAASGADIGQLGEVLGSAIITMDDWRATLGNLELELC